MLIIFTCLDYYYRVTTLYVKTSDPDESKFSCTVKNLSYCYVCYCLIDYQYSRNIVKMFLKCLYR